MKNGPIFGSKSINLKCYDYFCFFNNEKSKTFFSNEKSKNKPPMTILVKLFPVCSDVTRPLILSSQDNSFS